MFPTDGDAMSHFDAYEDLVGRWRWRLRTADDRTVATSGESFESHWHALRAAEDMRAVARGANISSAPGDGVEDALDALIHRELTLSR
jgi:uncharacterized protein YegP (UPF0339 family)